MGQIVAEQLVEILKSAGVRRVYGVTGCCADSSKSITPHNQWFRCSVKNGIHRFKRQVDCIVLLRKLR